LHAALEAIAQNKCPFANLPSNRTGHWGEGITAEDMTALRWVKPRIVVEVSFVEWTRDGLLRHPEFLGTRDDKRPREIRREP
jgi:bifunctional non-homologous end joining protein LigD